MTRTLSLIAVLILIIVSIAYLESGKVRPSSDAVVDSEIPIAPFASSTMAAAGRGEEDAAPSAGAALSPSPRPSAPIDRTGIIAAKADKYARAKEISTPDGFINTDGLPITIAENIGKKVILLDIWTYSCINCQRTLPYLNSWQEKYADDGLLIIGLHTPEFEFEKEIENVQAAVLKFGIEYPVVLDNDYSTWRAYKNNYWPRKYLIDIDGFIAYDHIGEGAYEETEEVIQKLLRERAEALGVAANVEEDLTRETVQPRFGLQSPETYFGAWRNDNFGNGRVGSVYESDFTFPAKLEANEFYLEGKWRVEREYIESLEAGARMSFPYVAKEVYMVAEAEPSQEATVLRDGSAGVSRGEDVSAAGKAAIGGSGLYKLIKEGAVGAHTLTVESGGPGLRIYTLTFGS